MKKLNLQFENVENEPALKLSPSFDSRYSYFGCKLNVCNTYPTVFRKVFMLSIMLMLFTSYSDFTYAQKLPNVQRNSLRAPATLKIDGKTTEWNNKFEAYNKATDIYYSLSNDDNKLYLVIQASDADVLTKITNCGVIFSVNQSGKKNDENSASVTFPIFELKYANKPYIRFSNTPKGADLRLLLSNPDSASRVANKKLHDNEKYIRTSGIKGVDTLISVYNQNGIKVGEGFDSTMAYTYELAIPLKILGLSVAKPEKFAYHISLPGVDMEKEMGFKMVQDANGMHLTMAPGAQAPTRDHLASIMATTDFWAEYILAK